MLHTIWAARKAKEAYEKKETALEEPDKRWERFQTKLFLFPDSPKEHAEFLRQLGEEDNRMQSYVSLSLILPS